MSKYLHKGKGLMRLPAASLQTPKYQLASCRVTCSAFRFSALQRRENEGGCGPRVHKRMVRGLFLSINCNWELGPCSPLIGTNAANYHIDSDSRSKNGK